MDKASERIQVLQENNTAQVTLESLLKRKGKKTNEISVSQSLSGNLDLKLLVTQGFKKIKHILFSKGQITQLLNIPDGLTHLSCEDNLLDSLDAIPDTIEVLSVSKNMLRELDLSRLQKLKILHVSHNDLKTLNGFPESLEELYCSYNQLETLDLKNTPKLKVLHCEGNVKLTMENIPDTVMDGQYPETLVVSRLENPRQRKSKSYDDYLKQYFTIKAKYEKDLMEIRVKHFEATENASSKKGNQKRKMNLNAKPKCLGCKKPVGMVFSNKDEKYTAICGGSPPCDWKIILHRGYFQDQTFLLYTFLEELTQLKQNFIRHKLNHVFEYVSERDSAKLFEKEKKLFQSCSTQLTELLDIYNSKYFNETKETKIIEKKQQIQTFLMDVKKSLDDGDVEQAVRIQHENVAPLAKAIQREMYEVSYVVSMTPQREVWVEAETNIDDPRQSHFLVQHEIHAEKLDENMRENPSVEYFGKKI